MDTSNTVAAGGSYDPNDRQLTLKPGPDEEPSQKKKKSKKNQGLCHPIKEQERYSQMCSVEPPKLKKAHQVLLSLLLGSRRCKNM